MKLLFVSNLYPPNAVGGYERLCHEVASAMVDRGHEVSVLTSTFGAKEQDFPGQRVHRALRLLAGESNIYEPFLGDGPAREVVNARNLEVTRRAIVASDPDVIFAWNLHFLDRSVLSELLRSGRRVVAMLTDNWLLAQQDGEFIGRFFREHVFGDRAFPPPHLRGWRRTLRRLTSGDPPPVRLGCDAIFGARFMRDIYEAGGMAFRDARVVHNGVRMAAQPPERLQDRSRLVHDAELRLLFAGRVVDVKGLHTAIEALALLPPDGKHPRATLTVVGDRQDAGYETRIRELVSRLGCADRVTFLDPIAESELFDLFQRHDIYVFPSLYEPFSLTLIHALAAGIPTVASRVGGNGEIARHGRTGLLFTKGDSAELARAIARLRDNPGLRCRLSEASFRVARGFTFERMVDEMERYLCVRGLESARRAVAT